PISVAQLPSISKAPVKHTQRPLVTLVIPGYNEAGVLKANMGVIFDYLDTLRNQYEFEVLIINDGSRDDTGAIAESLKSARPEIQVIHHPTNFGLGQAFKTAFAVSSGDYVITMDADLSYAPETIGDLLAALRKNGTKLALASAYMKGGKVTNVPWLRKVLSRWGNKMFAALIGNKYSTFTCMVRGYDGPFIRSLEPKSTGMGIMPEVIYKTLMLDGRIVEVPAHLDWTAQIQAAPVRSSSMRLVSHIVSTFVSGFVFRPVVMLLVPGLLVMLFSAYVNFWLFVELIGAIGRAGGQLDVAARILFDEHPATMLIGLLTLLLAIQMVSLGALSLQSKKYFEDTYFQLVKLRRQIGSTSAPMAPSQPANPSVPTGRQSPSADELVESN
ncbi:MAG: glycosyltransferase family 2 protein, partial [Burkholderiaceae bacterium]